MCGIIGAVGKKKDQVSLKRELSNLSHRGPDAQGYVSSNKFWLGHSRLSIIDRDSRANQPFQDYVDKNQLVYNGEIYNFKDLREELKSHGISFSTDSDTEVILHSWRKWQFDCFIKFKGMFAMAIWDDTNSKLVIARDRFGEKPLYYTIKQQGTFYFSSELRSTINISGNSDICPSSLNEFLYFNYVASPNSIISGIKKLNPGSFGVWEKNKFNEQKYWTIPKPRTYSDSGIASSIREKLINAIEGTSQSDVPIGLCLSGGIDSTAIAVLAKKELGMSLDCISVGYEGEPDCDETGLAKKTCVEYGHRFHRLKLGVRDILRNFSQMVSAIDEPVSDISGSSYFTVFKKSKELGLKVMLGGLGGDEIFCGYDFHNKNVNNSMIREQIRKIGVLKHHFPVKYLKEFIGYLRGDNEQLFKNCSQIFEQNESWENQILWVKKPYPANSVPLFLNEPYRSEIKSNRFPAKLLTKKKNETWIGGMRRMLLKNWLEGDCLSMVDRLAMHFSVESRAPFLHSDIADFALSFHPRLHTTGGVAKQLLKDALSGDIKNEILSRNKMGFTPPTELWKKQIIKSHLNILKRSQITDYVSLSNINNTTILFNLTFLATWLESLTQNKKINH